MNTNQGCSPAGFCDKTTTNRARDANLESIESRSAAGVAISVVLPVRNEQGSLRSLDHELRSALLAVGRRAQIIYVNDGSTDDSHRILHELLGEGDTEDIRTQVITLRRGYGQTAALAAGIDHAEAPVIITLDADGQNNPSDIPRFLAKLDEGFDVVTGWRRARSDGWFLRTFPSTVANWLIRKTTRVPIHDMGCTFKACRAPVLREMRLYGDVHRYLPVFFVDNGATLAEIEVDHRPRQSDKSNYGLARIPRVLVDLLFMYFVTRYYTRPMHLFGLSSVLFFVMAALSGFLMFAFNYGWLGIIGVDYHANFVDTPLPTLTAVAFLGSVISAFAGILAEVLVRIRFESGNIKPYAVQELHDSWETERR